MAEIFSSQFVSEEDDSLFPGNHQSICFICAKKLSSLNIKEEQSYSIRIVFRHLKISLLTQLHKADTQPVDVVTFCESCYKIFSTLSSYYADLEVLKMRIHYFLTELNKLTIVEDVEEKCDLISIARKQLKKKLREKCIFIDQTGPFVVLPQLDIGEIGIVNGSKTNDKFDCLSEVEDEPEESGDDIFQISDSQCHSSDVDYESDKSLPTANKSTRSTKSSSRNKHRTHRCLECNREFKSKDSLLEHSPLIHPEKHFPPETKSDHLTPQQYKMYLTHLINTEVDSCGSYKAGGYKCSYCPKTLKNKRRHTFRLHLTKEHQDQLLDKLDKLQKDVSPEQMLKIFKNPIRSKLNQFNSEIEKNFKLKQLCKIKNRMKFEHTCSVCEVRTTSLRKHEAIHHPEQFLISKRLENVSLDEFKMYCGYLISKQVENFTKSQEDGNFRFKCPYCANSYIDSYSCRNHLILGHVNLLSIEIEKLQKTIKPEELKRVKPLETKRYDRSRQKNSKVATVKCEICDVCLTQRSMTIHMRKNHPHEYLKSSVGEVCSICTQKFRYKWWFDFHKTGCHAHIIFEKWKGEMTSVEQFKSYCQYMLETEIRGLGQVGTTNRKIRFKCSYCTTTFSDTKYTQIHLVRDHKEILGSILVDLQKNKTVDEVEQDVIIKREKSEERFGEEEEEYFEATEVFCETSVVKQEASEIWTGNDNGDHEIMDLDDINEMCSENMGTQSINEDCKMKEETVLPD